MKKYCSDKKTVVFLPLVKTSQKFRDLLNEHGFQAAEVNGNSQDRAEILADFETGKYNVLCNSMLLTEGWDCPSVDCIVVLRPTKVRSFLLPDGRPWTRLFPGKDHLLLLDFLWHTERHELCHPASLICSNEEVAQKNDGEFGRGGRLVPIDIEDAEQKASGGCCSAKRRGSCKAACRNEKKTKEKACGSTAVRNKHPGRRLVRICPGFGWEWDRLPINRNPH